MRAWMTAVTAILLGLVIVVEMHITDSSSHPCGPGSQHPDCSSPGEPARIMNVSAYCTCEKCCGKWADGLTASGVPAMGRICAAPPEYPFGTVFEVEGYGEYVCEDRGGAIKGNKLDLLFPTHGEAKKFGRKKNLKVRIVE